MLTTSTCSTALLCATFPWLTNLDKKVSDSSLLACCFFPASVDVLTTGTLEHLRAATKGGADPDPESECLITAGSNVESHATSCEGHTILSVINMPMNVPVNARIMSFQRYCFKFYISCFEHGLVWYVWNSCALLHMCAGSQQQVLPSDVLWSDPSPNPGHRFNVLRGIGTVFGPDVTEVGHRHQQRL